MAAPEITRNFLDIVESTRIGLTTDNLNATLAGVPPAEIFFLVSPAIDPGTGEALPIRGEFLLRGTVTQTFSLQDLSSGLVEFRHLGSNFPPQYTVSALFEAERSAESAPTIIFEALNDGPIVRTNVLSLDEGETVTLTSDNLFTTDEESSAAQLRYTILSVSNGNFQRVSGEVVTNLTVGGTFTQAEIDSQVIRFRHDGSETAPRYELRVIDSGIPGKNPKGNTTSVIIERFTRVNDTPVIRTNAISLSEGDTIPITTENLAATDVEDDDSTLQFRITSVTNGRFELLDETGAVSSILASPSTAPITFTQNDVIQGRVQFVNDPATDTPPTYTLEVSDSGNPDGVKVVSQPGTVEFFPENDLPVLQTVSLTLEEGETLNLSGTDLRVTDEESGPEDVRYTVLSVFGGEFVSQVDGSTLDSFTQAELNAGTVVAFQHDNGNAAPVFALEVTDGDGASIVVDSGDGVDFTAINDAPEVQRAALVLTEGGRVTLSSGDNLAATDEESVASQLTYTVTLDNSGREEAKRDRFIVNGTETFGPTVTFTQADVNAGRVDFVHGGSNLAPSLTVALSDTPLEAGGLVNIVPVDVQITFTPTNDTPLFSLNTLTIAEGGTVVLSGLDNLTTTDEESTAADLTYAIDAVSNGTFQRQVEGGDPVDLAIGDTFTQAEVNDGLIQFAHDDSNIAPSYTLTVTDAPVGADPAKSVTRTVEIPPGGFIAENDAPELGNNAIALTEGESFFLTGDNLSATDEEDPSGTLTFTVTDISNGRFERVTFDQGGAETGVEILTPAEGDPVGFTQAEIAAGRIRFVNDPATDTAPAYTVTVTDAGGLTDSGTVTVDFTATNDVPIFSLNTLTIAEGGTVVLNQLADNLVTTDEESTAVELTYAIDAVSNGTFQRRVGVDTFEDLAVGDTFTQAEADGGLIQFVHDGSETAPSYTLTVTDTPVGEDPAKSVTRTLEIPEGGFTLDNDAPELENNTLALAEGDAVFLTLDNLSATDEEDADDSLTFTVASITNGRFERVTFDEAGIEVGAQLLTPSEGDPVGFTQAEVAAGRIRFVHDPANDTAPTYAITVTDAGGLTDSGDAVIDFRVENDLPVLEAFQMTIAEGETVNLTGLGDAANILLVTDEETLPDSLIYTVTNTVGGSFVDAAGAVVTSFSQAAVTAGDVLFQQDDSNTAPSFSLSLTDGENILTVSSADDLGVTFVPFNDVPTVLKSELAIAEGGTVTLSPELNLNVTDEESAPAEVVYTATVTSVDGDRPDGFEVNGVFQTGADITFTQADVNAGLVKFIHGGSNFAPVVTLEVSDRTLPDAVAGGNNPNRLTLNFLITFTVENDMPLVEKNILTLSEGETVTLLPDFLLTTDEETAPEALVYTIDAVTNGQFQVFDADLGEVVAVLAVGDTFTQADIDAGILQFAHNGDEAPPSYTLTVADEPQVEGAAPNRVTTTVTIPEGGFQNVNDNPTFSANQLSLEEGDRLTLTSKNLAARDVESPTSQLTFEISDVQGGTFFFRGQALAPEQTFNTAAIAFGELEFEHDGEEAAPSYTVTVRDPDGGLFTQAAAIDFKGVNDLPEITQNFFEITEGVRLELSTANLLATDAESLLDSELRFTISNVVGGAFFDFEANPVESFTQEQLRNGDINFVPLPASEADVTPAFDITVDDGDGGIVTVPANVRFISVNDAPSLGNNALTLTEGDTVVLTSSNLSAIDSDDVASSLIFTVTSVTGGRFERVTVGEAGEDVIENLTPEGAEPIGFTQGEVAAGLIRFVNDPATNTPPTYAVQVSDAGGLTDSGDAAIAFTAVNDAPEFLLNTLTITEGGTVLLSRENVLSSDEETATVELVYTLDAVTNGTFQRLGEEGVTDLVVGDTFTQEEVDLERIQFVHDGGETAPDYTLTVSDTGIDGNPETIKTATLGLTIPEGGFQLENDAPELGNNTLTLTEGDTVVLTSANLSATDVDDEASTLVFTITNVTNGKFERVTRNGETGEEIIETLTPEGADPVGFTQAEVAAGLIRFVNDPATETTPAYTVVVADAGGLSDTGDAAVIYTSENDAPDFQINLLAITEGGQVTLGTGNLLTEDEESGAADLTYTIDAVSNGTFQRLGAGDPTPLAVGDTFTQADVEAGLIRFVHDGGEVAPDYTLTVRDTGINGIPETIKSATLSVTIPDGGFIPENDAPVLDKNFLTLAEGQTVVLTPDDLSVSDPDNATDALTLTVTSVTGGRFERVTVDPDTGEATVQLLTPAGAPPVGFSQAEIAAGLIRFVNDPAVDTPPTYTVQVRDPDGLSSSGAADITFDAENDLPVLEQLAIAIAEGATEPLSTANLQVTDEESAPADLIYTVTAVTAGKFILLADESELLTFTQADLDAGDVVGFQHDNSETPPSFTLSVTDGENILEISSDDLDGITYRPLNDIPVVDPKAFAVVEGGSVLLTATELNTTDVESGPADLTYQVTLTNADPEQPDGFEVNGVLLTSDITFTQADIDAGRVKFVHGGSNFAPQIEMTVTDTFDPEAEQVTVPVELAVTFTASNDVPEVITNTLSLSEGETVTLSAANLLTEDEETAAADLVYTIDEVNGGQFQIFDADLGLVTQVLAVGDTFTQADVNAGILQFAHDGDEEPPSYTLTVADVPLAEGETPNTVTTTVTIPDGGFQNVNDAPTFSANRLEIEEGGTVVFTTNNLLATDVDSLDSRLEFEITDVAQGTFFLRGQELAPGQTFGIAAISFGELSFKHDDGELPPSYTVIVRDAEGAANTAPATIVFREVNDDPRITINSFTITEGERLELSTLNLLAADDETIAEADLKFTVSEVVGGAFFDFLGNPVDSFTQEQVRNGEINFLPVPVDGPDIPPTFTITVEDGDGGTATEAAKVTFISVNEAPVLSTNSFTITEGELTVLTPDDLAATDDDTAAADLLFTVSDVLGGRFLIGETTVEQFTQADLVAGLVTFEDDGDQEPPSFAISVGDGELTSEPETAVIAEFVNTNDAPVAVNDGGDDFVTDEKTPFLTGDVLLNDEDEDPLDELRVVAINGQTVTPGTSVTLASGAIVTFGVDIANPIGTDEEVPGVDLSGRFLYDPNGQFNFLNVAGTTFDSFEYTIADLDGATSTAVVTVEVRGVDDAPTLVSNSLTLFSGQAVSLSSANVLAIDPDTNPANLVFTASNITGGQFLIGGQVVESFTQQDILNRAVVFQHDGGTLPPTYELSVTDGTSTTEPAGVTINRFVPFNLAAIDGGIFDYAQTLRFLGVAGASADELGGISLPDLFDEQYYLATNPDVFAAVQSGALPSGYQHFISSGITEGRNPSILFNEDFYLATNPAVGDAVRAGAIASGLQHFLLTGASELRVASQNFNQQTYLDANPDVLAAVRDRSLNSGFEHYVEAGGNEGRSPELFLFNEGFYLANYSDVQAAVQSEAFVDGFAHFIQFGQFEGRDPSKLFNEASYLTLNPDVAAAVRAGAFTSGFSHYVQAGRFEDRLVFA